MTFKPNRPVRVGTKMTMTDSKGNVPGKRAVAPEQSADLPALSGMTKDELIAQAEKEGVDLSDASNNDERREAIEKARG